MSSHVFRWLSASAIAAGALLMSGAAGAATGVNFCDFSNQTQIGALSVNGDAQKIANVIELTPNATNKTGSAYLTSPIDLGPATSFETHFRFRMYPNSGASGGSGITFTFQNKSPTSIGGSGGGLGINGITPSVSVEFDASKDVNGDPDDNHVAVDQDGHTNASLAVASSPVPFKGTTTVDGGTFARAVDAWIDYDGATKTIAVFIAGTNDGGNVAKPGSPTLTTTLDIYQATQASKNANHVLIGFTGATGNTDTNNQDVILWQYLVGEGTLPPLNDCIPCSSDTQCLGTPTPACEPTGFCGQCSATNTTACVGSTPACDVSTGTCVECNTNTDCGSGTNTPICQAHVCVACQNDFGGTQPACYDPRFPACQKSGPLQGACSECSGTNASLCLQPTPVCLTSVGVCGCLNNLECSPDGGTTTGLVCTGTTPTCQPGCITGQVDCPTGQQCDVTDGGLGQCIQACGGDQDCTTDPLRHCNPGTAQCVQCLTDPQCPTGEICNTTTHTCGECSPTNNTCTGSTQGPICTTNDTCGCNTDTDCGGANSGRVCDDTTKVCIPGCRTSGGGNGCPNGDVCTSADGGVIGSCNPFTGDAGTDAGKDAGPDGSLGDGGGDGGGNDASLGGDSSLGGDGSGLGDGSSGFDSGFGDTATEGGGCNCSTPGGSDDAGSLSLASVMACLAMAGAFVRRRRNRK